MACEINIPISGSMETVLLKVREAIEKNGGSFTGDHQSGAFHLKIMGTIAGKYLSSGTGLQIIVEQKPLFISCSQIESFLLTKLNG